LKYLCKTDILGLKMNSLVHFRHGQSTGVICLLAFIWRRSLQLLFAVITYGKVSLWLW